MSAPRRSAPDLDHRRAQEHALPPIAGAEQIGDLLGGAITGFVGDRLVDSRIERVARLRVDAFESLSDQGVHQESGDLGDGLAGTVGDGQVGGVEHGEELVDEGLGGPLQVLGLQLQRALLEVLEVGLQPAQGVEVVVPLALERQQVRLDRQLGVGQGGLDGVGDVAGREVAGTGIAGGAPERGLHVGGGISPLRRRERLVVHGHAVPVPGSSTISASTTSSSLTLAPLGPGPPVPLDACCDAASYRRWAKPWLTCISWSVLRRMASTSEPARESFRAPTEVSTLDRSEASILSPFSRSSFSVWYTSVSAWLRVSASSLRRRSSSAWASASRTMRSMSSRPSDDWPVMVIDCSLPVARSLALTWTMPLASMSKVTSICGTARGAGGRSTSWNLPRVLL